MAFRQYMKTNAKNVIDLAGVLVVLFSYARSQESKKTRSRLLSIGIRYTQEQSPAKYGSVSFHLFSSFSIVFFSILSSLVRTSFLFLPPNAWPAITETQ